MKYINYSVQDLVADAYFQRWVLAPDAETSSFWESWLQHYPEKKKEVEEAISIINVLGFQSDYEANTAFIDVWNKIKTEKSIGKAPEAKIIAFPKLHHLQRFQKLAAVFIGLLVLSVSMFFFLQKEEQLAQHHTKFGEVKTFKLPDGSEVMLNSNSSLSYNPEWSNKEPREVWLKGEAYFSVLKKQTQGNAKFKVHTRNLSVEVLGTKFNVKDRRNSTAVVLESGKVKLNTLGTGTAKSHEMLLKPSDYAIYLADRKTLNKQQVNTTLYTSWVSNKLLLNKVSLQEIGNLLEDNYGLHITFADADLAQKKFTGSIPRDNYKLLLDIISKLYNIEIIKEGNHLLFSEKENKM